MPSTEAPPIAPTLTSLLTSLTASLQSTFDSLPVKSSSYLPPPNGISLLDLKNEAMLSYLHNIVYLVLIRLRSSKGDEKADIKTCVEQLVELRAMLEKGVKPVEAKLRYQIEKVVRKSIDAETVGAKKGKNDRDGSSSDHEDDEDEEDESSEDDEDGPRADDAPKNGTIRINNTLDIDGQPVLTKSITAAAATSTSTEDLVFRPNPLAFPTSTNTGLSAAAKASSSDGIYHPPRISAVSMPTGPPAQTDPLASTTTARRNKRSHNLDEFIASELSSAPLAEPSIGSTIVSSGRGIKTVQARREETERREYEETNFVRLPKLSKKEAAQKRKKDGRVDTFGGEDWRSFAGDLDRITARTGRSGGAGKVNAVLERSRKRKEGEDAEEGSGRRVQMGRRFNKIVGRENSKRRRKA